MTPPPSVRPLSHGCSAPHLTAQPVLIPTHSPGSDAKSQILLPAPLPGHAVHRLPPENLNKISLPKNKGSRDRLLQLKQLSQKQHNSRSPFAKCLQLPARSGFIPEGQSSSSLAGCATPAWAGFAQGSALLRLSALAVWRLLGEALSPAWSYPCCQACCPSRATLCPLPPQHSAATSGRKTGPEHT